MRPEVAETTPCRCLLCLCCAAAKQAPRPSMSAREAENFEIGKRRCGAGAFPGALDAKRILMLFHPPRLGIEPRRRPLGAFKVLSPPACVLC